GDPDPDPRRAAWRGRGADHELGEWAVGRGRAPLTTAVEGTRRRRASNRDARRGSAHPKNDARAAPNTKKTATCWPSFALGAAHDSGAPSKATCARSRRNRLVRA